MSRCTLPERAATSTLSEPLMRLPDRASMPRRSSAAWRSAACVFSPRSAGTRTSFVLNARCSAPLSLPLALAASSSPRPTPIHAPRPGARARASGATSPSGDKARRMSSSLVPFRRVRMHVRSGTCDSLSSFRLSPVSLVVFRNSVLLLLRSVARIRCGHVVLEPMGARGHDDLVALLFGKPVFRQDSALVLGPVARLAAAGLNPFLLDQLVGGEVGEIVESADVGL